MVNLRSHQKGFTLPEVILTAAIVGTIALVLPSLIHNTFTYFILTRAKLELQREARSAMEVITRNIRQAQASTIIIDRVIGQPYYSRISFTKNQLITGSSTTYVSMSFYQTGTNLMVTRGATITKLSTNLRYLAFSFPRSDDMNLVSVALTLEESTFLGRKKALHMASEKVQVMNP